MDHYLDASTVSARNAALEKEHIPMLLSNISHQTIAPIANLRLYGKLLQAQSLDEESRDYVNALNVQTGFLSRQDVPAGNRHRRGRTGTGLLPLLPLSAFGHTRKRIRLCGQFARQNAESFKTIRLFLVRGKEKL